ncbi:hypothetical protein [Pedobacter cryophilus]|uniref:Aerotolerance regulator N-terminal domain-containing protein n=1 Tax=Pedobacter cryophilus TaxID=2571271 RepID=A0A4U1BZJ2_9SPHI|nr:hypothetical protein [Pedobacter cryophilus]TKB96926.1 hypothetical protein FA046_12690 [Pedobacter cryophilus]
MNVHYIIILSALIFLAFLLFKEWKRENSSRLWIRMIGSAIAVVSLVLLLIPIKYEVEKKESINELVIFTEGVNLDSLPKNKKVYTVDSSLLQKNFKTKLTYIPDLAYYLAKHPQVKQVNVYGNGLASADLASIKKLQFTFHPSAFPSGIPSIYWDRQIISTHKLQVQGTYLNNLSKPVQLVLKGLGSNLDSVVINKKESISFSLTHTPKLVGKAVYKLIALSGKDTLSQEEIPFEVIEKPPVKVLVLAASPDFEYKFLKNWLYQNQYPVVFRSRISKDKFSVDYLNTKSTSVDKVNQSLLQQFDLLIADDAELALLSASEKLTLEKQIEQGLGLLIRINENKPISVFSKKFAYGAPSTIRDKSYRLKLMENLLSPLEIDQPLYFNLKSGNQPVVFTSEAKIMVNNMMYGSGKIMVSTIPATYHWFLNGLKIDYANFWTELINKSAKKYNNQLQYKIEPAFPLINQQANIHIENPEAGNPVSILVDSLVLAPLQNKYMPFVWKGTFWPQQKGWHSLKVNQQSATSFYVFGENSWSSIRDADKIKANLQIAKVQLQKPAELLEKSEKEKREVSKWWFFFLFLMSAGYLWAEGRMD